jgi:hypothetical protein
VIRDLTEASRFWVQEDNQVVIWDAVIAAMMPHSLLDWVVRQRGVMAGRGRVEGMRAFSAFRFVLLLRESK